jgi:hypothetical protein
VYTRYKMYLVCKCYVNKPLLKCVSVALVIQHEKCMRSVILISVACLAVPYFSTLSHKSHDFRKKRLLNIKYVFIYSTTFVSNISHSKNNSAINVQRSSCKVPVSVVRF